MDSRPQQSAVVTTSTVWYRFSQCLLLLLAICYVLQIASPLRINPDALILLSMGDSAAHGSNILFGGPKTLFPPGYPLLLDILMRAGLAHSWTIITLNLIFLSVGLYATYSLMIFEFFNDRTIVLLICSFILLSFVVVKHITIPLTDVPFFGCSISCLAVLNLATKANGRRCFIVLAVLACILVIAALFIRRAGVALLPPFIFMIVSSSQLKSTLKSMSGRAKLVIITICAVMCIGMVLVVIKTFTLSDLAGEVKNFKISVLVIRTLHYRFKELGMLMVNCPLLKMPVYFQIITEWIGSILFILVLYGLITRQKKIDTSAVYLISYMGILFMWPYPDARFWLPVIPLLTAYFVLAVKRFRLPMFATMTYYVIYAMLGFAAIAYSTRISYAGSAFPDRYADGSLKSTYCAAFKTCLDSGDPTTINSWALRLIRDYQ